MELHFLGANQQVTGSRYLLNAAGLRIMIDCGMFQERQCLARNWEHPPVPPDDVDVLLLTHAHLDHCGLIPKFVKAGYHNSILATPASIDLARLVLEDAARIQKEDAEYKLKRHKRDRRKGPHPVVALYLPEDADASFRLFHNVTYNKPVTLNDSVTVTYHDAGHILGSAMLELNISEGSTTKRIIFSGDVGQWDRPLMEDPAHFDRADWIVMESTYGDRDHERDASVEDALAGVINDTVKRGGNIVIPTFAIDRAQELMYHLSRLVHADRIPRLTCFLDSPMATNATTIYKRFRHLLDDDTQAALERNEHPFQFPGLHFVRNAAESRAINSIRGSTIIMSAAGMCTGGRVKHHLRHNISRKEGTVLFTGYQANGTLGREILDGKKRVRIHGRTYDVHAHIERLYGLSAHADRSGLMQWLRHFQSPPKALFLTHGELDAANSLAATVRDKLGWHVHIPEYRERVEM